MIIVLTNVCIEHPLSRQCNTPRMSFPITNYLLFCRGILHSSVPPKKLSLLKYLVIATEKCLTFLQYSWANCDRARREEAKKGGYSVRVNTSYDLILSCFCFRTVDVPFRVHIPSDLRPFLRSLPGTCKDTALVHRSSLRPTLNNPEGHLKNGSCQW